MAFSMLAAHATRIAPQRVMEPHAVMDKFAPNMSFATTDSRICAATATPTAPVWEAAQPVGMALSALNWSSATMGMQTIAVAAMRIALAQEAAQSAETD